MNRYKGMLALLALQFGASASAADARTQCGQQADLVEVMLTVRADGFPRQGVEAELQKRYATAPSGYWQQAVPQHLLKFAYKTDGLKPVAAREYFFNLCLTEAGDIHSDNTTAALFAVAKDCEQQFGSDKAKIKACVDQAIVPIITEAWNAKNKGAK